VVHSKREVKYFYWKVSQLQFTVTVHCSSRTIALVKLVSVSDPRLFNALLLRTGHFLLGWTRLLDSRTLGCHTHIAVLLSCSIHKSGIVTGLLNNGRNWLTAHKIKLWLFQQLRSTDWQSWIIAPSSTKHDIKSPPVIVHLQYSRVLWFQFWGLIDLSVQFAVTGLTQCRRQFN